MRQSRDRSDARGNRMPARSRLAAIGDFRRSESGASVIIFSLSFALLMLVTAVAIDYGRAELERVQMQRALDAAALAAAHQLGLPDQDAKARAAAEIFYQVNSPKNAQTHIDSMSLDAVKGEVNMTSGGNSLTSLLNAFGKRTIALGASSRVSKGDGTIEVALVLDNSGSMAGQPIEDLKLAATDLVTQVFAGGEQDDRVRIGVVPFAGSVNVGADKKDSGWIDVDGLSPVHFENLADPRNRFDLFATMGTGWAGCVEARPGPHDVEDTLPSAANPSTLFVPMFAPDEPDAGNDGGSNYYNNYLSDFGGSCPPPQQVCVRWNNRRQRCDQWGPQPLDPATAQSRTCKYDSTSPSGAGPNYSCTTRAIQALTPIKSEVEGAIDLMYANGYTNIAEGVMWGWRVLSPETPFTQGRGWADDKNQKVIVLMTDGENTYPASGNHNRSYYGAFSYAVKNRLGNSYGQSSLVSQMNTKTATGCSNAKTRGVTIYTIAFRLESNPTTLSLLQTCASGGDKAYRASDGESLKQVFRSIGREISKLRVSS